MTTAPIRLAIVGMGKIARDQHLAAISGNDAFSLVAIASPNHRHDSVPSYPSVAALLDACPDVDALAICTPPQIRYEITRYALDRGHHVMLEKPPGATLSEVTALAELATRRNATLFATWHSREAPAVAPARSWLATRTIRSVSVTWKEDVRVWHPGQTWIWKPGGLGVFDPGINALSILTHILPGALVLQQAELSYPANCEAPIAARLQLVDQSGIAIQAEFDFRQTGTPIWTIDIVTDAGRFVLSRGGCVLQIDGKARVEATDREYANLYAKFASLLRERRSDVDVAPLRLVADAFLCGRRIEVEPFYE
jgi:D-galactose 1-dehydrogenase